MALGLRDSCLTIPELRDSNPVVADVRTFPTSFRANPLVITANSPAVLQYQCFSFRNVPELFDSFIIIFARTHAHTLMVALCDVSLFLPTPPQPYRLANNCLASVTAHPPHRPIPTPPPSPTPRLHGGWLGTSEGCWGKKNKHSKISISPRLASLSVCRQQRAPPRARASPYHTPAFRGTKLRC